MKMLDIFYYGFIGIVFIVMGLRINVLQAQVKKDRQDAIDSQASLYQVVKSIQYEVDVLAESTIPEKTQ